MVCSGSSSLPEVLTDPEARFDPWDVDDIARVMQSALTDDRFAARLDAVPDAGFTWELAADRLAANAGLRNQIQARSLEGMPIYAECGGFMYLCEALLAQAGGDV